jgi:hypothetical protein
MTLTPIGDFVLSALLFGRTITADAAVSIVDRARYRYRSATVICVRFMLATIPTREMLWSVSIRPQGFRVSNEYRRGGRPR